LAGVTLKDLVVGYIQLNDEEQLVFQDNLAGAGFRAHEECFSKPKRQARTAVRFWRILWGDGEQSAFS
jgi:hypothetical protein